MGEYNDLTRELGDVDGLFGGDALMPEVFRGTFRSGFVGSNPLSCLEGLTSFPIIRLSRSSSRELYVFVGVTGGSSGATSFRLASRSARSLSAFSLASRIISSSFILWTSKTNVAEGVARLPPGTAGCM